MSEEEFVKLPETKREAHIEFQYYKILENINNLVVGLAGAALKKFQERK